MIPIYLAAIATSATLFTLVLTIYLTRVDTLGRLAELRRRLGAPEADDGASILRGEVRSKIERLLDESGLGWQSSQFTNWTICTGAACALLGAILGGPALAMLTTLGGLSFFPAWAILARHKRHRRCDEQMPGALQLMVLALRAGHALPGALNLAGREAPQPVRDELRIACEQHALGRPIGAVLEGLASRLPSCESAQTFAVAVLVLEQTGGNLIGVLDRIIESARARTQYKARLRALTAQGRSSAWILGSLPPAFALIAAIFDPTYSKTLAEPSGLIVVLMVVVLWLMGVGWTVQMVNKEMA